MRWSPTSAGGAHSLAGFAPNDPDYRKESAMLWTILIILVIIALVLFILGRVRGGGRSL